MLQIQFDSDSLQQEEIPECDQKVMLAGYDKDLENLLLYTLHFYGFQPVLYEHGINNPDEQTIGELDYIIADCSGAYSVDLIKRLRKQFPLAIIVATSEKDCNVALLEAGANDFLRKPFVPFNLAMMLGGGEIASELY